jgi:hypothetical protein
MATVAEGLFGITPESLMAERDRQAQAQALRVAQLDPLQQARFSGFMATNQLGNAVGGLLGAQDPELMRVRQRQEMLQGVDIADPAALRQAAQRAMAANDFQAAQMLNDRALASERTQAQINADVALASQRRAQETKITAAGEREEQLRQALSALPPEASDKEVQAVVRQYGDPDKIFASLERSQKAEADRLAKAELDREKLAQREQELQFRREQAAANAALRSSVTDVQRQIAQARLDEINSKRTDKAEKQEAAKTLAVNHATKVIGDVQEATGLVRGTTTGLLGKGQSFVPGTDAFNLNQRLLTIKANLGFDRLQQMRDASPTGGALGQVAVQELNALQATVGSLEIGQDRKELDKNLSKIEHHYSNWIRTTQGEKPVSFEEFMKTKEATKAAPAPAAGGWSIRPR